MPTYVLAVQLITMKLLYHRFVRRVRRDFKLKVGDTHHMPFQDNDFSPFYEQYPDKYEPVIKFTAKNAPIFTVPLARQPHLIKKCLQQKTANENTMSMQSQQVQSGTNTQQQGKRKARKSDLDSTTSDLCLDGATYDKKLAELHAEST